VGGSNKTLLLLTKMSASFFLIPDVLKWEILVMHNAQLKKFYLGQIIILLICHIANSFLL